jgi:membrane-associated protease RseP (regulator of RpoE activity)
MSKKSNQHSFALACLLVAAACVAGSAQTPRTEPGESLAATVAQLVALGGGNFLGVHTEDVTRENAGRFQLSGGPRGVGVSEIVEGGPAAKAGLQKNDVIVRFDSEQVTSAAKLRRLIAEAAPGQAVRLAVLRGGAEREFVVNLGRREGALDNLRLEPGQVWSFDGDQLKKQSEEWKKFGDEWKKQGDHWKQQGEEWKQHNEELRRMLEKMPRGNYAFSFAPGRRIGVTTTELTEQLAEHFGVPERRGVLVTSVAADSPAAKAGLKAGDVITEADGEKLEDAGELSRVINRKEEGDVTLTVVRDRSRRSLRVAPEKRERRELLPLDARPDGPAAGLFTLPRVETRDGRAILLNPGRRAPAPNVIVREPGRTWMLDERHIESLVAPRVNIRSLVAPRLKGAPRLVAPARPRGRTIIL